MNDESGAVAALVRDHLDNQLRDAWGAIGADWPARLEGSGLIDKPPEDGPTTLYTEGPLVLRQYRSKLRERKKTAKAKAPSEEVFYAMLWKAFLQKPQVKSGYYFEAGIYEQTQLIKEAIDVSFEEAASKMVHFDDDGVIIAGEDSASKGTVLSTVSTRAKAAAEVRSRLAAATIPEHGDRDSSRGDSSHGHSHSRDRDTLARDRDDTLARENSHNDTSPAAEADASTQRDSSSDKRGDRSSGASGGRHTRWLPPNDSASVAAMRARRQREADDGPTPMDASRVFSQSIARSSVQQQEHQQQEHHQQEHQHQEHQHQEHQQQEHQQEGVCLLEL